MISVCECGVASAAFPVSFKFPQIPLIYNSSECKILYKTIKCFCPLVNKNKYYNLQYCCHLVNKSEFYYEVLATVLPLSM